MSPRTRTADTPIRSAICRIAAALCVAAAAAVGVLPSGAGAIAPVEVGYWSRPVPFQADTVEGQSTQAVLFTSAPAQVPDPTIPPTTAPLPVPPPTLPPPPVTLPDPGQPLPNPGVPDGGFWVANDATGATAISALRFRGDIGEARLTILLAPGSSFVGPIVACPALSDWTPEANGPWNNRPAHDCDRLEVSGRVNPEATGLLFDIPQGFGEFGEQRLDIVLLPKRDAGDPYSLQFQAPDESALEVFSDQALPDTSDPLPPSDDGTLEPTPPPPAASSPVAPLPRSIPSTSGFTTTTDAAPPTEDFAAPATPSTPSTPSGPVDALVEALEDDPVARYVSVGLLLAMGAAFFLFGGQTAREPRLLGGLAGSGAASAAAVTSTPSPDHAPNARGIGRFRKPRSGKPNRL